MAGDGGPDWDWGGAGAGAATGAGSGAAIGAGIGSLIAPGAGTLVGGLIGAGVGAIGGGVGGGLLGGAAAADAEEFAQAKQDAAREKLRRDELAAAKMRADAAAAQSRLDPWAQAGQQANQAQMALAGLLGPDAQRAAIAQIEGSPQYAAMLQQGEQGILANAAATGGVRGGNTQAALAQFRPQLLSSLIEQQYARLGGMSAAGMQASGQQGNASLGFAGLNVPFYQSMGDAAAGVIQAPAEIGYLQSQMGLKNFLGGLAGLSSALPRMGTIPGPATSPTPAV